MVGIWVKSSRMSGHVSDPCFREIPPSGLKIPLIIEVEILHSAADHLHTYIKMITFLLYMILIYRWYILYTDTPYRSLIERTYYQTVSTVSPKFGSKIHSHHNETTGHDGESIQLLPCLFHLFGGYSLCAEHPEFTVPPAASLEALFFDFSSWINKGDVSNDMGKWRNARWSIQIHPNTQAL